MEKSYNYQVERGIHKTKESSDVKKNESLIRLNENRSVFSCTLTVVEALTNNFIYQWLKLPKKLKQFLVLIRSCH